MEIVRTAEGHADVKWPTRKGGYYTLQYSTSLAEAGWTDLFTAYAGGTSTLGNVATYTGVRVYNAPVPGTPPPASSTENHAFSLRRDGAKTLAVWQSAEGSAPTAFAYLNQDWGTGSLANLPPISTYNCPGGYSLTLVVADPLPLPSPLPEAVNTAAEATALSALERVRLARLMDNRSTVLGVLASGLPSATVPPAGPTPPITNEAGQTIYTTGIPGGENGVLVDTSASTTPVGPRQFFRVRETEADSDGDGIPDWDEYALGLNAFATDSDGDGISDGAADLDHDGVSNADEMAHGTDPSNVTSFPPVWRSLNKDCLYTYYTFASPAYGMFLWSGDWAADLSVGSPETLNTALDIATPGANGMVNRLNSKLSFPAVSALAPLPTRGSTGFSLDVNAYAWIRNTAGEGPDGAVEHFRVWLARSPAASAALARKALKVTTALIADQVQTTSLANVTFTIPPGGTVSNVVDLTPHHAAPSLNAQSYSTREELAGFEAAPEVLRVNTDFDEGRLDLATGFALDDASDEDLRADRNGPDGRIKAGEVVTEDLHQGWFGLNPNALSASFYDGGSVHIKKLNVTDPDTGRPESGHVRLWVTQGSGTTGQAWPVKSYDFSTLLPVNLVGLVYGSTATIPAGGDKKYWLEGVKAGRITLEFRFTKGALSFTNAQTFQVQTRQTMLEWKREVDYQIALQTLDDTTPLPRFSSSLALMPPTLQSYKEAMEMVSEFYDYYRQLWTSSGGQVTDWSGMARVVANQVTAALIDQEYRSGWAGMRELQIELMAGAQSIFRDKAWQHRAYNASGLGALRHVLDDETAQGRPRSFLYNSWAALDDALATGNSAQAAIANQQFLEREQFTIVQRHYNRIKAMKLVWLISAPWVLDRLAANPMPGGMMFLQVVPSGDLTNANQRWDWITLNMLPRWRSYTPAYRQALVQYGLYDRVPFYMWDPLAPPLVWDHEDKPVGGLQ